MAGEYCADRGQCDTDDNLTRASATCRVQMLFQMAYYLTVSEVPPLPNQSILTTVVSSSTASAEPTKLPRRAGTSSVARRPSGY